MRKILPIFIPHEGCPYRCAFCNQRSITGYQKAPPPEQIQQMIETGLETAGSSVELAFYGGSFTAVRADYRRQLLRLCRPYLDKGQISSLRISTRPDAIDGEILRELEQGGVKTIELGVQSMDDAVLLRSGRGHTSRHVRQAVEQVRRFDFVLGLQTMMGLPGAGAEEPGETARAVAALSPDIVRIYPTIVLPGSPLYEWWQSGQYTPMPLEAAVEGCADALEIYQKNNIEVIRIGLQATGQLSQMVAAGPYHPAMGEMVYARIYRRRLAELVQGRRETTLLFSVPQGKLSQAQGQKKCNLSWLREQYPEKMIILYERAGQKSPLKLFAAR